MSANFFQSAPRRSARRRRNQPSLAIVAMAAAFACATVEPAPVGAETEKGADTALIVSVDVSQSVDAQRYRLQMEGIAQALEDPSVVSAITSGPSGAILLSMVTWSDQAEVAIGWQLIASQQDAATVANLVRSLPQRGGEFTCIARMLHTTAVTIIPSLKINGPRVVVDVSGDGTDNCDDLNALHTERDAVLATGATINGLPILVKGENDVVGSGAYRAPGFGLKELSKTPDHDVTTLDQWFRDHVIGGPLTFLLPAHGYDDFARAMRQKFVTEISYLGTPNRSLSDVRQSALVHR